MSRKVDSYRNGKKDGQEDTVGKRQPKGACDSPEVEAYWQGVDEALKERVRVVGLRLWS